MESAAIVQPCPTSDDALSCGGLVIGVWGAAGGVGSTSVAINIARMLSAGLNHRVCLFDLRLDGGDAGFFLGLNSWANWDGIRREFLRLTPEALDSLLPVANDGLKVFWLPETAVDARCTSGHVMRLVTLARISFDVVLLDIPAGWSDVSDAALESCDAVILVTTPEFSPVRRMRAAAVRSMSSRPGLRPLLVMNRGRGREEVSPHEAQKMLGMDFAAIVPYLPGLSGAWTRRPVLGATTGQIVQDRSVPDHEKKALRLWRSNEPGKTPGAEVWAALAKVAYGGARIARESGRGGKDDRGKVSSLAPQSSGWERLKQTVHARLAVVLGEERLEYAMDNPIAHDSALRARVERLATQVLAGFSEAAIISKEDRRLLLMELVDDAIGLGYVDGLLRDPSVTEIIVASGGQVFAEREGRLAPTGRSFSNQGQVYRVIERIVAPLGRRIDESSPMVDARLPDGSRVNAVIPPIALDGPVLTVRKFALSPFTIADLVRFGSVTPELAEFFEYCVVERKNIIVTGGAGSGKTTLLNVLSGFIPRAERVITVEDAAELRLQQPNVSRLEARPPNIEGKGAVSIRQLVRNALRMRPDRIIVGEVRGGEALDMLQAMNTGHEGSLTTMHANSPEDALSRLETMVLMAGIELPVRAVREQIVSAIDLFVHQSRLRDGSRKVVEVAEVRGIRDGRICLDTVFRLDANAAPGSVGHAVHAQVGIREDGGALAQAWRTAA